jgi:hypothetical protein
MWNKTGVNKDLIGAGQTAAELAGASTFARFGGFAGVSGVNDDAGLFADFFFAGAGALKIRSAFVKSSFLKLLMCMRMHARKVRQDGQECQFGGLGDASIPNRLLCEA